jgi:hypothetical protein
MDATLALPDACTTATGSCVTGAEAALHLDLLIMGGLAGRVGKRDAGAGLSALQTAGSSSDRLGHSSGPSLRKQRTPEGAMNVWEGKARCKDHDASAAPTFAGDGYRDSLSPPACHDAAAVGRYSDATAASDDNLERCWPPESPVQVSSSAQTERSLPEPGPSAQPAHVPYSWAHDARLADIALSQLEALAVEAMDEQETNEAMSNFTNSCRDDTRFSFLGGSHAQRTGRAVELADAAPVPADTMYPSARMVNSLPTAGGEPKPAPQNQLPVRAHGAAGSTASLPPKFTHPSPAQNIMMSASRPSLARANDMISIGAVPRPSAMAVEMQLGSRSTSFKGSLERREWTAAEDEMIRSGVERFGSRWRRIAELVPGRSDDAVRNRWNRLKEAEAAEAEATNPPSPTSDSCGEDFTESSAGTVSLEQGGAHESPDDAAGVKIERKKSWSTAEDTFIVNAVKLYGHKWNKIADGLPGRTDHATRNRWQRLLKLEEETRNTCPKSNSKGGGRVALAPTHEPGHALPPHLQH